MLMLLGIAFGLFLLVSVVLAVVVAIAALLLAVIRVTRFVGIATALVAVAGSIVAGVGCVVLLLIIALGEHVNLQLVFFSAMVGFAWAGLGGALVSGALRVMFAFVTALGSRN